MSHRVERVNSLIRQELSELLHREIKDPRLSGMISITSVETAPDLKYAKIFVSGIGGKKEEAKTLKALNYAAGFFRTELARNLKLRRIPELSFYWDDSIEHGDRIMQLIDQVSSEQDE